METFRIEVGHAHQVKPTNIVGAIANETGLDSGIIGKIEIFQEHSNVDLLAGMPRKIFDTLKHVKIAGRRLNITRLGEPFTDEPAAEPDHPRPQVPDREPPAARQPKPPAPNAKHHAGAKPSRPADRKGRPSAKKFKPKTKSKRATAKS